MQRLDQRAEIAVAGKEHDVIDMRRNFHRVDRQLDIHIAFDLAAPLAVGEFLGRFGHHGEAVVMQPIHERTDRAVFVVFQERRIIKGPQQLAASHELLPKKLVIDVEPQALAGRIEIRAIDEERDALITIEHYCYSFQCAKRPREWCRQ